MHIVIRAEPGEEPRGFFGRPLLFHCELCNQVKSARMVEVSQESWQKESAVLLKQGLRSEDVWWFHTRCERCQSAGSTSVAI
ncbi:MAG: hypothetical protein K0S45_2621 [Nitrospira sp.]|jgi:hypothetical protein|nr:hypothetical protein [Nitrospira sp.]